MLASPTMHCRRFFFGLILAPVFHLSPTPRPMNPTLPPRCSRDRRAKRLGRDIALALAAGGSAGGGTVPPLRSRRY